MKTSSNSLAISGVLKKKTKKPGTGFSGHRHGSGGDSSPPGNLGGVARAWAALRAALVCNPHGCARKHTLPKPCLGTTVHLETPPPRPSCWFQCDPSATALTPPQLRRPPEVSTPPAGKVGPQWLLHGGLVTRVQLVTQCHQQNGKLRACMLKCRQS